MILKNLNQLKHILIYDIVTMSDERMLKKKKRHTTT